MLFATSMTITFLLSAVQPIASLSLAMSTPSDPAETAIESRQVFGKCMPMEPLAKMLVEKDGVKKIVPVECRHVIYSQPPEKKASAERGMVAFAGAKSKNGAFFRGKWNDGAFYPDEFSVDQRHWDKVTKGRIAFYKEDDGAGTTIVAFAVLDNAAKEGVAFRFEVGAK